MTLRTYILVFQENLETRTDEMKLFADALNEGERLFRFDYNVAFLQSTKDVEALTQRLRASPLNKTLFFISDITDASRAGNMVSAFWDILHHGDKLTAA